jgi:hypothetical protein
MEVTMYFSINTHRMGNRYQMSDAEKNGSLGNHNMGSRGEEIYL